MTDEEKKAIERFKNFIYTYQDVIEDDYSDYEEKESAKEYQEVSEKILNLIEKQSKEIEELKAINKMQKYRIEVIDEREFISKDKIKAKVIEIKNRPVKDEFITATQGKLNTIIDIESLLNEEE